MELKIVFEKRALFEFWVDRFVAGGDFQVLGVFDEQVDKSALGADSRLEGNLFLDAMVFADDHDQFQVFAGAKADLPLEDAFRIGKKPVTGEPIQIPARKKPVFHASKELNQLINRERSTERPVYVETVQTPVFAA